MIISGKKIAKQIREEIKNELNFSKLNPKLVVIQVGDRPDSNSYIKAKMKAAEEVGIEFEHKPFPKMVPEEELIKVIEQLNEQEDISGIIVQLPLPDDIDSSNLINSIDPRKDVDGLTTINAGKLVKGEKGLFPCTALGVMELLKRSNIEIAGKKVTVIGRSALVGTPLAQMLIKENATVTVCHSKTKDIKSETLKSDIVVVAIGSPKFLTRDMVKEGTTIIDVGINLVDGKLVGDTDYENLKDITNITPVPGGVGPMTVAMLLNNTVVACKELQKENQIIK